MKRVVFADTLISAPSLRAGAAPMRPIGLAFAVATLAVLAQFWLGTVDDVSWLLTAGEKMLDGQRAYVDFIEVNPPASLLVYLPAILLARHVGATPEFVVVILGFLGVGASLGLCAAILRRAGLLQSFGPLALGVGLVALLLMPGRVFDERDHIAALAGLPLLAAFAARAAGAPIDWRLAALAGAGAGIMASIKPPYALVVLFALPYLTWMTGLRALFRCAEFYGALAVGGAYVAIVQFYFPAYLSDVMPLGVALYLPIRETMLRLALDTGAIIWLTLLVSLFLIARKSWQEPLIVTLALGSCGALASFFIQGKGWSYHVYPALAFVVLAFGVALERNAPGPRLILAGVCASAAAALIAFEVGRWPIQILVGVAFCAAMICDSAEKLLDEADRARGMPLVEMLAASAIGVAFAMFASEGLHEPALAHALARLGPHPRVLAISESLGLGHPLVRQAGGVWVQRVPSQWMTAAAMRLIEENPDDAALRARLAPYQRRDHDMLVEDIVRNRPDAILIGRLGTKFSAWAWSDPAIAAARADYQFFASNEDKDWPAMIYARKDLIGLRGASAEANAIGAQTQGLLR